MMTPEMLVVILLILAPILAIHLIRRDFVLGVLLGIIFIVLGFGMMTSPLQYKTGYTETVIDANTTQVTYTYQEVPITYGNLSFSFLMGLFYMVVGIHYIWKNAFSR